MTIACGLDKTPSLAAYSGKVAVVYEGIGDIARYQGLAERLAMPIYHRPLPIEPAFYLCWRDDALTLVDTASCGQSALTLEIHPRPGEQRSFPAPKQGPLAQAIGRKTRTVVDATTGWAQDSLALFRMNYNLICLERSPLMFELINDGFKRLERLEWVQKKNLNVPLLMGGDAIEFLAALPNEPDCIYLDPMFPPKRKKSALAKKTMRVLRELAGADEDKEALFMAAWNTSAKRIVVKSPDDYPPFAGKPSQSVAGKLVRYDVYLK